MRVLPFLLVAAVLAVAVPVALAAAPAPVQPGARVDLEVLLLSADGSEPGYAAWKAELDRQGVPYDAIVAGTAPAIADDQLADYGDHHAKYQAVILASGDLGANVTNADGTVSYLSALSDAEWAALAKYERTFGIRQLSDYTAPSPAHGLQAAGGAVQDGAAATLTAAGRLAFPYLEGPVTIADDDPVAGEAFGYRATPVNPAAWQSLVAAPDGSSYLGIYTHPDDGREEMVMTVAGNQFQNHDQLLRDGMLNWVTRGVFLGYARNYLELQVDDLFLGDDAWNPTTNVTDFSLPPSRMTPADVDQATAWSRTRRLRLDFAFNGGGSDQYAAENGNDPLAAKFSDPAVRGAFGYVNHTYDHPNLDCSTAAFIVKEIADNRSWAERHGLPITGSEVVTGEHSGLANSRPGNPGTLDPPIVDDIIPATGGAVPAGTYDYALTAASAAGETTASVVPGVAVAAPDTAVTATFAPQCHAVAYTLYRRAAGATAWTKVATLARDPAAATDDGSAPLELSLTDTAAAGTAGEPSATDVAALAPYAQNPQLVSGLAGIGVIATDASKSYPVDPSAIAGAQWPAGTAFALGAIRTVPRYPSNVYYNVSTQGGQLDEYNWIYTSPPVGGCVPVPAVTTCRTAELTWAQYVASDIAIMFRHVTGNDPRPHYFHQSNLADYNPGLPETDPAQGGVLYPVIDALLARYEGAFERASAPLIQLTTSQIAAALAQQSTWAASRAGIAAWLRDGVVHVRNTTSAPISVPLTGTTAGERYAGQRSGWTTVAGGAELDLAPADPAPAGAPAISGRPQVGETLKATAGTWNGTAPISVAYQWQRCSGSDCSNLDGATGASYVATEADRGARLRVVALAGNWVSSVSQAASAKSDEVAAAPDRAREDRGSARSGGGNGSRGGRGAHLALTSVSMNPRRFPVAHRHARRGTRLDGALIRWRLNKPAKVRLKFERRAGRRWVAVGAITRSARAGAGVVRFRGRFGRELLPPQRYRLVIRASAVGERTPSKRLAFRVVNG
jgi:hypothetical protein